MNVLGIHVMVELKECNPGLLDDLAYIREAMTQAADAAGATIIGESFHQFNPQGVTGILAISESHLCIHTWPEYGYAAADIFTCGENFDPSKAAQILIDKLESRAPLLTEYRRGILTELAATA
ncbi:MAG: adenosylmethionine decarboxylase [Dehalococcoidia bacterium]|nr:adenosylmethionine decarboxylase [Dehalococcoidia bacterium]